MIIERELLHGSEPAPEYPVDATIDQSLNLCVLSQHARTAACEDQDFIPFNSKTSRWLIYSLLTQNNVRRLLSSVTPQFILTKCFQIPDSPELLNQMFHFEKPAFSRHSDIFLTAVGISIYAKLNTTLETIIKHLIRHVYHSEICAAVCQTGFVRNVCKSTKDTCVDAFNIATLSILRGNIDGLLLLMEYGLYDPQEEFTLVQWNSHFETVSYYRDLLDFCVYQLRYLPCLPISSILGQMVRFTNRRFSNCRLERPFPENSVGYDLTVFDVYISTNQMKESQSIFRRTLLVVFEDSYFANEVAASILSVLEIIQKTAFFAQCTSHKILTHYELHQKRSTPTTVLKTEKSVPSLTLNKLSFKKILTSDALQSIALLLLWYENASLVHGEDSLKAVRIVTLMTRILLDIGQMSLLFEKSDKELCDYFTKLISQNVTKHNFGKLLDPACINNLRMKICDVICKNVPLAKRFRNQCKASPNDLLLARGLNISKPMEGVKVKFTGSKGSAPSRNQQYYAPYVYISDSANHSVPCNNSNLSKKIFCHESGFLRNSQSRSIAIRNGYFPPVRPPSTEMERPIGVLSTMHDHVRYVKHMEERKTSRPIENSHTHDKDLQQPTSYHKANVPRRGDEPMIVISSGFSDFLRDTESRNTAHLEERQSLNFFENSVVNPGGDNLDYAEGLSVSDIEDSSYPTLTCSGEATMPQTLIPRLELWSSSDEVDDEVTSNPSDISVCSRSPGTYLSTE